MSSLRGFAAAVVFLAALPVAALCEALAGGGEVAIHLTFALGAALMALAIFDFSTPRWIAWMGCAASVFLAVTFLLQGVSTWASDDALIHFAYQILGQRLEAWAGDLFFLWCFAMLLVDSRGWTRIVGAAAMALAIGMRGYAYWLSFHGRSLGTEAPVLQSLTSAVPLAGARGREAAGAPFESARRDGAVGLRPGGLDSFSGSGCCWVCGEEDPASHLTDCRGRAVGLYLS